MDNNPDSLDEHLYEAGMHIAKKRIDSSNFFICQVIRGIHDNPSLLEQIRYAKEQKKPIYLLIERGAQDPPNLNVADIRCREYFDCNRDSIEEATRRILARAVEDFPGRTGINMQISSDLNGIVNWPQKG